jgi:nicotinic acid phosphoribosyltransferase
MVMNGSILFKLMIPYIRQKFSKSAASFIGKTFQKPTASSDTDTTLSLALKQFDAQNDKNYIFEIPWGIFRIDSGRFFENGCTG